MNLRELLSILDVTPKVDPGSWAMLLTKVTWYQVLASTGLEEWEFKVCECDKADYEDKHESLIPWLAGFGMNVICSLSLKQGLTVYVASSGLLLQLSSWDYRYESPYPILNQKFFSVNQSKIVQDRERMSSIKYLLISLNK